ncbi:TetR/AcrR family transcriptional regulator [Pseudohoeflea coraliihabitans]|uniref:TetR/AcrR family transcriptional regulator n=1 Tax=Pseudohoeflea coraliihabitans TaxID=2860393 RepID=A0ABS6WJV9_9HYPH|nr:helix-turn-helix domain-containing protein [Pseudohoeflea sp. DP4N28-3]MBW3096233.1 TetR/AcrR family transcriptional regulator [Pseudohoeflea sp. DP4N28-3]
MKSSNTGQEILAIARKIIAEEGLGAVSFDAIARHIGRSKQAVLYWYPTKRDLLVAMFLPWLEAETRAAEEAVSDATNKNEAIGSFVRAIAAFHLADLDRFRMMYLALQTTQLKSDISGSFVAGEEIYSVTNRLYGMLADHLGEDQKAARKKAVVIHSAVLGLVLMCALSDALRDPLKHSQADLIDALITTLTE